MADAYDRDGKDGGMAAGVENGGKNLLSVARGVKSYKDLKSSGYSAQQLKDAAVQVRDWNTIYYMDYLMGLEDLANQYGVTIDDLANEGAVYSRTSYWSRQNPSPDKEGWNSGHKDILLSAEDNVSSISGRLKKDKKDEEDRRLAAEENAKPFDKTPEMLAVENTLLSAAGMKRDENGNWTDDPNYVAPKFEAPEFTPEYTQQWMGKVQEMDRPGTERAIGRLNETMNFVNPYGVGSGSTGKAQSELQANILANQQARAMALGQASYEKDYNAKYGDYTYKRGARDDARKNLKDLSAFYYGAKQAEKEGRLNEYWKRFQADTAQYNSDQQTDREDFIYQRDKNNAAYIAALNTPREQGWWEAPLAAITSGAGMMFGGQLGGMATGGLFAPKQTAMPYNGQGFGSNWNGNFDYNQMRKFYGF